MTRMLHKIKRRFFPLKEELNNMNSSTASLTSQSTTTSITSKSTTTSYFESISDMSMNSNKMINTSDDSKIENLISKFNSTSLGQSIQEVDRENVFSLLSLSKHLETGVLDIVKQSNSFIKFILYRDITTLHTTFLRKEMMVEIHTMNKKGNFPTMEEELCMKEGPRTVHDYVEPGYSIQQALHLGADLLKNLKLYSEEAQNSKDIHNILETLDFHFVEYSPELMIARAIVKQSWKLIRDFQHKEKSGGLGLNQNSLESSVLDVDTNEFTEDLTDPIRPYWIDKQEGNKDGIITILQETGDSDEENNEPEMGNFRRINKIDIIKEKYSKN